MDNQEVMNPNVVNNLVISEDNAEKVLEIQEKEDTMNNQKVEMNRIKVVINGSHKLLPQQIALLGGEYELIKIPEEGLSSEEIYRLKHALTESIERGHSVVILSPIPLLVKLLYSWYERNTKTDKYGERLPARYGKLLLFHNDKREKKLLPDGREVTVVAQDGWELL